MKGASADGALDGRSAGGWHLSCCATDRYTEAAAGWVWRDGLRGGGGGPGGEKEQQDAGAGFPVGAPSRAAGEAAGIGRRRGNPSLASASGATRGGK